DVAWFLSSSRGAGWLRTWSEGMRSFADDVTPVILTGDEERNIRRTLAQLQWAREVVVCDSFSGDRTVEIAHSFPNVRVVQRRFDDLAAQWTFAFSETTTEWILALDADYYVPTEFSQELAALRPTRETSAFEASFVYAINGRSLRGSLYPPHPVVLRRDRVEVSMDGHAQRFLVTGQTSKMIASLVHDDRKSLRRFIKRQKSYMRQEAAKIRSADPRTLNATARIRRLRVVAPLVIVPYVLLGKGLIFDGLAGLRYSFERLVAELILSLELFRPSR
ncbi:MAG: glycosyltransferase family 2 protein, partial [Acidobacteriota bacterium]